ncbi:MAG: hypothetical protein ACFFAU_07165 [Candidatus Hodarchaeota archaeon]
MFQIPNRKILTFQFFFFSILVVTSLISFITAITLIFPPSLQDSEILTEETGRYKPAVFEDLIDLTTSNTISKTLDQFPDILSIAIVAICVFVLLVSLILWTPSFSGVITADKSGRTLWVRNKFGIPERLFCFRINNIQIKVKRNRSSLNGLLMRAFNLEIHFKEETPEIQRIADFTGMKRKTKSIKSPILCKTVKIKNLPLQLIQVRALLATLLNTHPALGKNS